MKKHIIVSLLLSSPFAWSQGIKQDTYTNEITQVNTWMDDNGVSRRIEFLLSAMSGVQVDTHGRNRTMQSIMGRSVFELKTTNDTTNEVSILDVKTIDSYLADIQEFKVEGPRIDSYNLTHPNEQRTQVGQGFVIKCKVSGLLPNGSTDSAGLPVPEAATSILLERSLYSYTEDQKEETNSEASSIIQQSIDKNGTLSIFTFTELTGDDLTKLRGKEVIQLYMRSDPSNGHNSNTPLTGPATITIWPLSDGLIHEPDADKTVDGMRMYRQFPDLTISLDDLYPGSSTYLKIKLDGKTLIEQYKPFINLNDYPVDKMDKNSITRKGQILNDTIMTAFRDKLAQDEKDIKTPLGYKHLFTVELWHKTPFDTVLLGKPFDFKLLDTKTEIKASINSIE